MPNEIWFNNTLFKNEIKWGSCGQSSAKIIDYLAIVKVKWPIFHLSATKHFRFRFQAKPKKLLLYRFFYTPNSCNSIDCVKLNGWMAKQFIYLPTDSLDSCQKENFPLCIWFQFVTISFPYAYAICNWMAKGNEANDGAGQRK